MKVIKFSKNAVNKHLSSVSGYDIVHDSERKINDFQTIMTILAILNVPEVIYFTLDVSQLDKDILL